MRTSKFGVELKTFSAPPLNVAGKKLTFQSQALTIRLPFYGWVWNRPVAVLVEQGDGSASLEPPQRIPIIDVTRLTLIGIGILAGCISIAVSVRAARKKG